MITPFFTFLFFAALELQTLVYQESTILLFIFPVLLFSLAWYYSQRMSVSIIALLYGVVSALSLSFFQIGISAQIAVFISTGIFYIFLSAIEARRPRIIGLISLLEFLAFFFFILSYQIYLETSSWIVVPSVFFFIMLIFSSSVSVMLNAGFWLKIRLIAFSMIAAAIMTELYVVLGKLPLHLINIDFLLFFVYYTLWDTAVRYFSMRLTKQSLMVSAALLIFGITSIILFSQWLP